MKRDGVTLSIDGKRIGTPLRASAPGIFLRAHPSRSGPFVRPGARVAAGEVLGLLAMGPILLPVTAPEACIVLSLTQVRAVGYGTPLVEIATFTELRAMGIAT
jgi:acetyl-CoA carboxylase biotin carboxyl carrier protein